MKAFTVCGAIFLLSGWLVINLGVPPNLATDLKQASNVFKQAQHILVFKGTGTKREFLGGLPPSSAAVHELCKILGEDEPTNAEALVKPAYEVALVSDTMNKVVKYDPTANVVVLYSIGNRELKFERALEVKKELTPLFKAAEPLSKPKEKVKPKHVIRGMVGGGPFDLTDLVRPDSMLRWNAQLLSYDPLLIVIGTPIAVLRNEYLSPDGEQYCVYLIGIEHYIKDDTGLYLPILKYNHNGGYLNGGVELEVDPLLQFGERYLLFLKPVIPGFVTYGASDGKQHRTRRYHEGEYVHVHPFLQTQLTNGETFPIDPTAPPKRYEFQDGKTTLVFKQEKQVIDEILAAIKQADKEAKK